MAETHSLRHVTRTCSEFSHQLLMNANDFDKLLKQKMMFCHQTRNDNFSRTCGRVVTTGTTYFFRPWTLFVFRILNNSIIGLNVLSRVPNWIVRCDALGGKFLNSACHKSLISLWYPAHICFRRPDVLTWRSVCLYCLIAKQLCLRALRVSE